MFPNARKMLRMGQNFMNYKELSKQHNSMMNVYESCEIFTKVSHNNNSSSPLYIHVCTYACDFVYLLCNNTSSYHGIITSYVFVLLVRGLLEYKMCICLIYIY